MPFLALAAALQPGLERIFLRCRALGIYPQHRRLDRAPAAIVEHHGEDRQPELLRHRINRVGVGEMEHAVAGDLHHAAVGLRQLDAERHAARAAQPAAAMREIGSGLGARQLAQHGMRIGDRLVDDNVVGRELGVEHRADMLDRQDAVLFSRGVGEALLARRARRGPGLDPRLDAGAEGIVGALLHRRQHLAQRGRAIRLQAQIGGEAPHRDIGLQRIDVDLDPADRRGLRLIARYPGHVDI